VLAAQICGVIGVRSLLARAENPLPQNGMTEVEFESDAFLSLLTEALRAGPGSPAWHEAIGRLRAGGIQYADEHRLLVRAREHLESGKSYRSVRAGPGFTQKLMSSIEQESARGTRTPPTATTIAVVSAGVMLGVLLVIGYLLWTSADKPPATPDGNVLLVHTVTEATFEGSPPTDWRKVGRLPVEFTRSAMRLKLGTETAATGGGVTWSQPIAPEEPFAVVASVRVHKPEENVVAQIFVSDQPEFSDENGTSPHELVWLIQGQQMQVILPSGRVAAQSEYPRDQRGSLTVSVTLDRDQASVEFGSSRERIWSGANGLDPGKPRYVGVRFLTRSKDAGDGVVFNSVRVNMRQK
jgi:hypothetical protein